MSPKISLAVSLGVLAIAGIVCSESAKAQDASTTPLADQLRAQYKLAKIVPQPNGAQQQVQGGQSSPAGLTNDDIIKLVQAKLPDSVVIAKIKSSNCDFDTSTDALIKLKQAGVSDSVLQAIIDAPPPPPPPDPGCSDYGACISSGDAALDSSRWDDAIAAFQAASTLDPSKPGALAGMGNAYLGASRKGEAASIWDKALSLGGPLTFAACHHRSMNSCEMGNLVLGPKNISFASAGGQQLFAVPPSQV